MHSPEGRGVSTLNEVYRAELQKESAEGMKEGLIPFWAVCGPIVGDQEKKPRSRTTFVGWKEGLPG
jgi:hypothetical protein